MFVTKTAQIPSVLLLVVTVAPTIAAEKKLEATLHDSVRLSVRPRSKAWFVREDGLFVDITIRNGSNKPIETLKLLKSIWTSQLSFHVEGRRSGVVRQSIKSRGATRPTAADYNEIPAGGILKFPVDLVNDMDYRPHKPDSYTLKAILMLKDGRKIRDHCSFVIKPIPKLKKRQHLRISRGPKVVRWFLGVDLGFAAIGSQKETLFCVVRESESGKKKFGNLPERTFRLMQAGTNAKIETMVYNPFPDVIDTIVQLHVLVTERNKPQHYFIVDLSSGAELKKNQTLKPGQRYKLHQKPLGPVQLVPVDRK